MEREFCLVLFFNVAVWLVVNGSCIDKDTRCKGWANSGECASNPSYMLKNCRKSCKKCEDKCKNREKDDDCNTWKKSNFCKETSSWYGFMKEYCQKSCGLCIDKDQAFHCSNKQSNKDCNNWRKKGYCDKSSKYYRFMSDKCQETCQLCKKEQAVPVNEKNCVDKDATKDCINWKNKGYCDATNRFYQYMTKNCFKTCAFCKTETAVSNKNCLDVDATKDCVTWKRKGYCDASHRYYNYMKKNCKKTCEYCGKVESEASNCKDAYNAKECARWAREEECKKNPGWMHVHCQKSCKKCPSSSSQTGSTSTSTGGNKDKSKDKSVTQINGQGCGLRFKARVVGGSDASIGDWPWQVGLARSYNPSTPFCGGSLINKQWIVTANHCFGRAGVSNVKPDQLVIRLGEHDISRKDGSEVVIKASKIVRHEDYKLGSYDADIALVKLESPVKYNAFIKPVCLPEQDDNERNGESCYVTGWGKVKEGGSQATVLQEAKLPIVSRKTCKEAFGIIARITDNMVCAGFKEGGIDACQGDSGGPFVCEKGGRFQLTGVVSFGRGCARANIYGVYAKVSKYVNWIKRKIKE